MQVVVRTQPLTELFGAAHEVQDHLFLPRFDPKSFVRDGFIILGTCKIEQVFERGLCFGGVSMSNVLQSKFELTVEGRSRWRLLLRSFISQSLA